MKKYVFFMASFLLLFILFQFLSGIILTYTFTLDVAGAWNSSTYLSKEVVIKSSQISFLLTLFIAFLSATIAYLILGKVTRNTRRNE